VETSGLEMPGGKVSHEKKGKARVYRGERWSRS
jgi:hypothetical protein